jgi:hypothetical protein
MTTSKLQQIINFIDANEFVTFKQINAQFPSMAEQMLFEELLQDGQIRQVVDNKLLGTYKYCLAA